MEDGNLVNDDIFAEFVGKRLRNINTPQGIIFDGYPRTIIQAKYLKNILKEKNIENLKVLNIVVSSKSLVTRMLKRSIDEKRIDDKPEVISNRIEVYNEQIRPLLEYYKKHDNVIGVDGEPPIDVVWQNIQKKIEND